jgi:ribosomal protein S18 acetylase RimI-like enzyme
MSPPPPPPLPPTGEAQQQYKGAKPGQIPVTLPPGGVPVLPSPPSLPSGATIVPLAEQHISALRRINSLLLPVPYPDSFYTKALEPLASGLFSRAILWQDSDADTPKVVGGLICRLEPNLFVDAQGHPLPQSNPLPTPHNAANLALDTPYHAIYIQSLVLLSPYRSLGLAAAALEHIIASAAVLPAAGSSIDARTVYAHVWTENEEGLKWYEARGFSRDAEPVQGYYFKLRPDTAWIVRRQIGPSPILSSLSTHNLAHTASRPAEAHIVPGVPASSSPATRSGTVLSSVVNLPPINPSTPPPSAPHPPVASEGVSTSGPPRRAGPSTSPAPSSVSSSSLSFQKARPETEWNDLPPDMVISGRRSNQQLLPTNNNGNGSSGSGASSRSSSAARERKKRAYPSAAFGN